MSSAMGIEMLLGFTLICLLLQVPIVFNIIKGISRNISIPILIGLLLIVILIPLGVSFPNNLYNVLALSALFIYYVYIIIKSFKSHPLILKIYSIILSIIAIAIIALISLLSSEGGITYKWSGDTREEYESDIACKYYYLSVGEGSFKIYKRYPSNKIPLLEKDLDISTSYGYLVPDNEYDNRSPCEKSYSRYKNKDSQ